ncbi:MAG: Ig-like domain repeat protein [Verrucomicrobia bacterium]|nr:Ig-like domain repeat protein [Verrucomicrobiota bacterium]
MKLLKLIENSRDNLKHFALAVVLAAGLAAGSAQAVNTTTTVINLGTAPNYTRFTRGGGLYTQIPAGTLPAGSILRAVSWNVSLWWSDPYLGDLAVYIADNDGSNPVLQVGSVGDYVDAAAPFTAPIQLPWNAGGNYSHGATAQTTLTAADGVPAIDLGPKTVFLENCYGDGGWAGTITLTYDIAALAVTVNTPANGQAYPDGTSITASATALEPSETLTDTVTFHTTPLSPAGSTVHTDSTDTSSPFTAVLGTLPAGTYEIYATVTNNDSTPGNAISPTHTFTVSPPQSTTTTLGATSPSTYGQSVTFTATVAPTPAGGTVQFKADDVNLGAPVAVNTTNGTASYSTSALPVVGPNSITADFSGYGVHLASTAAAVTQTVNMAPLTVKALNTLRAPNTANPDPLPYQITGYQNGESFATSGVTGTPALTTDATLSSPAGNYDITCALGSLAASNYSFTLVNGTLTVAVVANMFSVNFYVGPDWPYGGLTTDEQKANVKVAPGMPAGLGDWYTSGWLNFLVPWAPTAPLAPVTLTSNQGSTATFTFKDCRNGWTQNGARTTLLGDGNGNMMDAHVNSTLDPGDGSNLFDMEVTSIPFAVYDVIFYMGANAAQYGTGTGKIVFNGGPEREFTVKPGAFDGTFTEMVDATTPGNYLIYKGVTGASFTTQTWGTGPTGFNHLGPNGFQIMEVAGYPAWQSANGATGETLDQDHDGDGVANGIEYFLGGPNGHTNGFTALPGVTNTGGTLSVTWTMGPGYTGVYGTNFSVETSETLTGVWNPESEGGTVTIVGSNVTYTFPTPLGEKKFVRLKVTGP